MFSPGWELQCQHHDGLSAAQLGTTPTLHPSQMLLLHFTSENCLQ